MRVIGRLLVATVVFLCAAVVMIAVLQSPLMNKRPASQTEEGASATEPLATVRTSGTSASPVRSVSTTPQGYSRGAGVVSEPIAALPVTESSGPLGQVLTPSTPVYVSNSTGSGVRQSPAETEQVETGLSVLNEEGLWIEVRLNREPYGFVRRKDLASN
jgi:hypothetical protein